MCTKSQVYCFSFGQGGGWRTNQLTHRHTHSHTLANMLANIGISPIDWSSHVNFILRFPFILFYFVCPTGILKDRIALVTPVYGKTYQHICQFVYSSTVPGQTKTDRAEIRYTHSPRPRGWELIFLETTSYSEPEWIPALLNWRRLLSNEWNQRKQLFPATPTTIDLCDNPRAINQIPMRYVLHNTTTRLI